MLYVITTQLHAHTQPDELFLLKEPQVGYNVLIQSLTTDQIHFDTDDDSSNFQQEEYIEELCQIQAVLKLARENKTAVMIHELTTDNHNLFYDFSLDEPIIAKPFNQKDAAILVDSYQKNVVYFGTFNGWTTQTKQLANEYNKNDVVVKQCGREIITVSYQGESSFFNTLIDEMIALSKRHQKSPVWIKAQRSKEFSARYTYEDLTQKRDTLLFENLVYASESMSQFIITNFITMHNEHRFFVVNNKIIDGSLTSGNLTPIKNGVLSNDSHLKDVNQVLLSYAKTQVKDLASTTQKLQPYTLDVAFNDQQEPIIVELNPIYNAGLYENNPYLIFKALIKGEQ